MNFGEILKALKEGKKAARVGWNGQGIFAYLVPANTYKAQTEAARAQFGENVPYRAYFALKTVQNDIAVWSPNTSDILAEDWVVLD